MLVLVVLRQVLVLVLVLSGAVAGAGVCAAANGACVRGCGVHADAGAVHADANGQLLNCVAVLAQHGLAAESVLVCFFLCRHQPCNWTCPSPDLDLDPYLPQLCNPLPDLDPFCPQFCNPVPDLDPYLPQWWRILQSFCQCWRILQSFLPEWWRILQLVLPDLLPR